MLTGQWGHCSVRIWWYYSDLWEIWLNGVDRVMNLNLNCSWAAIQIQILYYVNSLLSVAGEVFVLKIKVTWRHWTDLWATPSICLSVRLSSHRLGSHDMLGWVGLWGFLWWAPSAKGKDHHGVSSGWSSVWHRSNTGLSSTQYEQIPIILGIWPFWLTPFFFRSITFWRAYG